MTKKTYTISLTNEELSLIHSALEYMADKYDLYGVEKIKSEINDLRKNLVTQFYKKFNSANETSSKDEASPKDIFKQSSIVYPKIMIEDLQSGRIFEFGKNCHDRLVISEDGRSLSYYNLQCGDGSLGDFRFYYGKPNEDEYGVNFYDADFYARMVENEFLF